MPTPNGLPLATRDRILELVGTGMRQQDVAFELGLTPGQVAGIVFRARKAMGHVPRPRVKGERREKLPRVIKAAAPKTETPAPVAPVPRGPAGGPSTPSVVPSGVTAGIRRGETTRARTHSSIPPARTCQWIEGEPSPDDRCKCGEPSFPGFSYCEPHLARAYQPRKDKTDGTQAPSIEEWNRERKRHLDALAGW